MNNIQCEFCEHEFNEDLVKYGCPNCHGEGLDEGIDTNGQISNES
jgi:Zn finger protein HypA/HybF involved in hydrogenase expression